MGEQGTRRWWKDGHSDYPAVARQDMLLDCEFMAVINDAARYSKRRK